MRSCVAASATPQSTDTDVGTLNVRSKAPTAWRIPAAVSSASILVVSVAQSSCVISGSSGDPLADAVDEALVRRVRAAELLACDRVATHPDRQRHLFFSDLHTELNLASAECADA